VARSLPCCLPQSGGRTVRLSCGWASPEALTIQLASARAQLQASQMRLHRSQVLTAKIGNGKTESETFLATI